MKVFRRYWLAPVVDSRGIPIHIVTQEVCDTAQRFLFGGLTAVQVRREKRPLAAMLIDTASHLAFHVPSPTAYGMKREAYVATSDHQIF
jgi:hypothetical protein